MSEAFFESTKKVVTVRGEAITVSPLAVKNLAKVSKALFPLFSSFSVSGTVPMLTLLEHTDAVIEIVALATDKPVEFIGSLDIAELLMLVTPVLEVNSDFFVKAVAPQIQSLMKLVGDAATKIQTA